MNILENASLLTFNTFRVHVKTRYLIEVSDVNDIRNFIGSELHAIRPKMVLGGGSNVLFTHDYDGCILRLSIKGIENISENDESVLLRAAAGENWDDFVAYCVKNGWGGIENLSYIPGTVGASPVQNIGAYGMEVRDSIEMVETIDLESGSTRKFSNKQCEFAYRNSIFRSDLQNRVIITHVTFRLKKNHCFNTSYHELKKELSLHPETTLGNIRSAVITIRKRKLPDVEILANAGSFFKNPVVDQTLLDSLKLRYPEIPFFLDSGGNIKLSAAWLIEHCTWKGRRVRNVGTYRKHPLVIVNYGGADGSEILSFAQKIQQSVLNHFGIGLETEVNII
ncbi:MAG: UDP-N-acetylmuramate dehydrogenase [Bacteroidales bacterium]|nr:UDP-N-acetylmuramate dehydrogenase [Bacteroidales bacterium]